MQVKKLREEIKGYKRQLKQPGAAAAAPSSPPTAPALETLCSLVFEHGSDLLFQLDETGAVTQLSAVAPAYVGLAPAEAVGRSFEELLREPDRPRWNNQRKAERTGSIVLTFATGRGAPAEAEVYCVPLRGEKGQPPTGWVGLARRTASSEVRNLDLLREETRLTSALAHELNQPLTAIGTTARACVRLLSSEQVEVDEEELLETVRQIARQADRASEIIRRLRDLMMQGKRHRARINLNELIRETLAPLAAEFKFHKAKIRLELSRGLPTVVVDEVQIGQVLLNLARNALDSMLLGPVVHRTLTISTISGPTEIVVSVIDYGMGLAPSVTDRLFEPFTSTKPQGMGLGLALSRHIVQAHGGRLWAAPNADRGMTFAFSLPLTERESPKE